MLPKHIRRMKEVFIFTLVEIFSIFSLSYVDTLRILLALCRALGCAFHPGYPMPLGTAKDQPGYPSVVAWGLRWWRPSISEWSAGKASGGHGWDWWDAVSGWVYESLHESTMKGERDYGSHMIIENKDKNIQELSSQEFQTHRPNHPRLNSSSFWLFDKGDST